MAGEIKFNIDTSNAVSQIDKLTESVQVLHEKMSKAIKNNDFTQATQISSLITNLQNYEKALKAEEQGIQSNLPLQRKPSFSKTSTGILNSVSSGISAASSGNTGGMLSASSSILSYIKPLVTANPAVATVIGGAMGLAGIGLVTNKLSEGWEKEMDEAIDINTLYNDSKFSNSAKENSNTIRDFYDTASKLKEGTSYSARETLELQKDLSKYNYNKESADKETRAILTAQFNTLADRNNLSRLAGIQNLYGYNGVSAIDNAYSGLKSLGLSEGRFDEFLQGIISAMEEGVKNGFVGSVEDIVNNVSIFGKLSGKNELWIGEAGREKTNKISSGFSSAVNLNSTLDMMMYGAARGVNINEKQLADIALKTSINQDILQDPSVLARVIMEQGINGPMFEEMFKNFIQNIESNFKDMPEAQLQAYSKSFGLNISGGASLMSLAQNWARNGYKNLPITEVHSITNDPQNKSTETNYKEAINTIKETVAKLGQTSLDIKTGIVQHVAKDVNAIYKFLVGPEQMDVNKHIDTVFGEGEEADKIKTEVEELAKGYNIGANDFSSEDIKKNTYRSVLETVLDKEDYLKRGSNQFIGNTEWINRSGTNLYDNSVAASLVYQKDLDVNKDAANILMSSIAQYASEGGLEKGILWWKHREAPDGEISDDEMISATNALSKNKTIVDMLTNKKDFDATAFEQAAEQTLKNVFGDINIIIQEDK